MKKTRETLEEIKSHGYELDFGTIFNHAFETYKKIVVNAGVALLLFALLFSFVGIGIVVGIIGFGTSLTDLQNFTILNFSTTGILLYSLIMILLTSIASPFNAGLFKMARKATKNEEVSIGVAFEYFSSPYFKNIFVASLVISAFTTLVSVGLELVGYKLLGILINLIFSFMTLLTIPLIVFGDLSPKEAIEGSIVIVSKQFFIILGLLIISLLFCMLGIFAFCIGILFTIPFISAMTYSIYTSIVNDDKNEQLENDNLDTETVVE